MRRLLLSLILDAQPPKPYGHALFDARYALVWEAELVLALITAAWRLRNDDTWHARLERLSYQALRRIERRRKLAGGKP